MSDDIIDYDNLFKKSVIPLVSYLRGI